jgi:hypothetical protein
MLNKLAFRNVRRSAKDYIVYFLTMAVITAVMFSFNTLIFSEDAKKIFQMAMIMEVMLDLATFFIVLIVSWLIHYMVRFMLEKRSQEFGIYLLIGMKRTEISKLYMRENLLLGLAAFVVGMGLGVLFQQILMAIFYRMIQLDFYIHLEWNLGCFLMTAGCYGGCYLLALFRCRRKFRKMNIHDLMNSQRQNEEVKESREQLKKWLFPLAIFFIAWFAVFLFTCKSWDSGTILFFIIGLVLTIYLFYTGLSAWIICYVRKKGGAIYHGDGLFLLRQFASKVKTMRFTLGTLTALFLLALLGSSIAFMFNGYQNKILEDKWPFDVQAFNSDAGYGFAKERKVLEDEAKVEDVFVYNIYVLPDALEISGLVGRGEDASSDGVTSDVRGKSSPAGREYASNQVNSYLYTHLREFGSEYVNADGTPNQQKIDKNEEQIYCKYDTYMRFSDYNRLREMIGLAPITLGEDGYVIHVKERVYGQVGDFSDALYVPGKDGERLKCAGYYTEGFSQDGHNGGDYVIVVPDAVAEAMKPYYSEMVAKLDGKAPEGLAEKLAVPDLEKLAEKLSEAEPEEFNLVMEMDDGSGGLKTGMWMDYLSYLDEGKFCTGSDSIVVVCYAVLVRDNLIPEVKYMLCSLMFPLFYIGLVFLCVAMTVLSVQQLSDSAKYRFRYRVLSQIGFGRGDISAIIFKQLAAYYLCPAAFAAAISGTVAVFVGENFNFYTGTRTAGGTYFLVAMALFFGIYAVYFAVTYIGFKRNVEG